LAIITAVIKNNLIGDDDDDDDDEEQISSSADFRYIKTFQIKNLRSGMFYKCD
jgi:hypothetical protein